MDSEQFRSIQTRRSFFARRIVRHIDDNLGPPADGRKALKAAWPAGLARTPGNAFRGDAIAQHGQFLGGGDGQCQVAESNDAPPVPEMISTSSPSTRNRIRVSPPVVFAAIVPATSALPESMPPALTSVTGARLRVALTARAPTEAIRSPSTRLASGCCGRVMAATPERRMPAFS